MPVVLRLLASLASLAVGAFSVFGFLASFEPGVSPAWKVGYAVLFAAAILGAMLPWRGSRRTTGERAQLHRDERGSGGE